MTTFEIPTVSTERLRLRAFQGSDLDAYAAMQANPEVMRFLVDGRTHARVEVWRIMAGSLGSWPLRGYGMWACVKADTSRFIGSIGIFQPLDWPEPELAYSLDRPFSGDRASRPRQRRRRATGCSDTFRWLALRASSGRTITRRSALPNGSARFMKVHSSCAGPQWSIGCIIGRDAPIA